MSLFRRPKKPVQRRVFSYGDDEDSENNDLNDCGTKTTDSSYFDNGSSNSGRTKSDNGGRSGGGGKERAKSPTIEKTKKKSSLLSFDDEAEEGEIFQVKKSSHSRKVMKQLDRERKKRKTKPTDGLSSAYGATADGSGSGSGGASGERSSSSYATSLSSSSGRHTTTTVTAGQKHRQSNLSFSQSSNPTEVHTDDLVIVVKKTEPSNNVILNGRAAFCAGRDDMSSEDESTNDYDEGGQRHRFAKPDMMKSLLESGSIPDAAMIHAARKSRQKARELGDFIALEDKQQEAAASNKGRFAQDTADDDDISDDDRRVDMSAITGAKEREERREQFYSVQDKYSDDNSDPETNEWEQQQLRKGVTGAQLITAQQDSAIYSNFISKSTVDRSEHLLSTGNLLQQAYAKTSIMLSSRGTSTGSSSTATNARKSTAEHGPAADSNGPAGRNQKAGWPRLPRDVVAKLEERFVHLRQLHNQHLTDIEQIDKDLAMLKMEEIELEVRAPLAAEKYRRYQELRGYVMDLVECLDEKVPQIDELEKSFIAIMSNQASTLIKRRHQDVRDQAKEITEAGKPGGIRKMLDDEERVRRAADREGRRTRRRQIRERMEISQSHMDGMSSDDEIHPDHDFQQHQSALELISTKAGILFNDTTSEFCELSAILERFDDWKRHDFTTYKDTYFNLCLPKILGPLIRSTLITWNPLQENCLEIDRMDWYQSVIMYSWSSGETETELADDPDLNLVPVIVEKIILPKLTEIIETCWDPLSTSQVLRLVGMISRLGRDYPTVKSTSKYLQMLFETIVKRIKLSLENDVFIPIFSKQCTGNQEAAKIAFFQRQFASALKLFRNFLSWQGILADSVLKELAITMLLNRYLLSALRVCTLVDATTKAYIIVNTLPRVWLQPETGILDSLQLFVQFLRGVSEQLEMRNLTHVDSIEKMTQILHSLHA